MLNVLIDYHRKQKTQQTYFQQTDKIKIIENAAEPYYNEGESDFNYKYLLSLIDELPEQQCLVFKLHVLEGYGHKEIAEQLGISEGTSKWHLSIAKKTLQEKVNATEENYLKKMVI